MFESYYLCGFSLLRRSFDSIIAGTNETVIAGGMESLSNTDMERGTLRAKLRQVDVSVEKFVFMM
ncbi:MAG: hypothetical protein ACRER2_07085 [Methylococcales bacterium]